MRFFRRLTSVTIFNLLLAILFSNSALAATGMFNPVFVPATNTYVSSTSVTGDLGAVTNNDTSVTFRIEGLERNQCYLFGQGTGWTSRVTHLLSLESNQRSSANTDLTFYTGDKNDGGWSGMYAAQAGGTLCGFKDNPDGSGPDEPANYIRSDENGVIWLYDMCENFEGIRTDCNKKFVLAKTYTFTIFHVTCFVQPDGRNLDRGDHIPDELCDLDKAKIKDGKPTLRIWGADSNDGFPDKLLSFNFTDTDGNHTASGFTPVACTGCQFTVVTATKKNSGQFDINSNTVQTEFGPLPRDPVELATVVLRIALGLAGGLAFLLMIYGAFRLIFAAGNPENVQHGREILTAAIVGLLVIIFSTFILQLVGISILGLNT